MSIWMAEMKQMMLKSAKVMALAGGALIAAVIPGMALAQAVPSALIFKSKMVVTTVNGNAGHLAANSAGDGFYVSQTDNTAYWLKHGTTTPVALLTGLSGGRSVYVDSSNNVYVPSNYSGSIVEFPYINGGYATGIALSSLTACTTAFPSTPCTQFGSGAATTSYYYQPTDLGIDGITTTTGGVTSTGEMFVVDEYNQTNAAGSGKFNAILKFVPATGAPTSATYVATKIVDNLPQNNSAQMAVDAKGNVYYADGSNLYSAPVPFGGDVAGTLRTATKITNAAITNPTGVTVDKYGNLFVTNANTPYAILEYPAVNGVAVTTGTPLNFDTTYSANGVAFDGLGDMFYTGYATTTNVNEATFTTFNVGSAAPGTAVALTTLTVQFLSSQTLTALTLNGAAAGFSYVAGTCAAGTAYVSGNSCNFNVNYTPNAVGLQQGAVTLTNASGGVIATALLRGTGLGAAQTTDPATVTAIGTGWKTPAGVAVDASKNVYLADPGQNAVFEYKSGSTTPISVGTGLSAPTGVALDNAGNLYIADSGNGRVVEVPNVAGTLTNASQAVIASGYKTQVGIALDGFGDLYIADALNVKLYQLQTLNGIPSTLLSQVVPLPSTAVTPYALATDASGNLFVGDSTSNTITEVAYLGKTQTSVGTGYSGISGLATDAAGSLYVADPGNQRLLKVPFEGGIFNTNDKYVVSPTGLTPTGVALDSVGNIYMTDSTDAVVDFLNRASATLALGKSNLNTSTAVQNAYVASSGNQSLVLGTPVYTQSGNTAQFTITSPNSNGCVSGQTLTTGYACVLAATFSAGTVGTYTDNLSFADNALNATPKLAITGQALNLAATSVVLTQTAPTGNAAFGQTVTIQAVISSALAGTPTGQLTFYVDGGLYKSYTVPPSTISVVLSGLTAGTHTVAAIYTGDDTYASSNQTLQITIVKASTTVALASTGLGAQAPVSATQGTVLTLTATVTPSTTTVPTGTVTFTTSTGTALGTGTVTSNNSCGATNPCITYIAKITTSVLPLGNNTVVATYSGDVNYSTSSTTLLVVISPALFTLTPSALSITVTAGQTGAATMQITSLSGYGPTYIGLNCSGLPANTACTFSPNGFQLQPSNTLINLPSGPTNITLNVVTGMTPPVAPPAVGALHLPGIKREIPLSLALLALAPFTLIFRRRMVKRLGKVATILPVLALLMVSVAMFTGCGSNLVGNTPAGTYNVTITAVGSPYPSSAPTVAAYQTTAALTLVVK